MKIWAWGALVGSFCLPVPTRAQVTQRVSVNSNGVQASSEGGAAITPDGRFVVFSSYDPMLVAGDTHYYWDVFVRDRQLGTTECVSVDPNGMPGNENSVGYSITPDGRYVAFFSSANNLVPGDTNSRDDIFVRDRILGTTERVSVDSSGMQSHGASWYPEISADGRFVAFSSESDNLVPGDTNSAVDVFVHDRITGTTERVSVATSGVEANAPCLYETPAISADGRYVAFSSWASNLAVGDNNGREDVFVRDRQGGTTERISLDSAGADLPGDSFWPSISSDGRFVSFESYFSSGVDFVRDRVNGTTELVSVDSGGTPANADCILPSLSADGRYVTFLSQADNLVPGDSGHWQDVFLRDRQFGKTERVSLDSAGYQAYGHSYSASVSADGRFVAFMSRAINLVPEDTNHWFDDFVRDRRGGTDFTSLCDPGGGTVIGCPCGNPPGGNGRGCDNSSNTGGAVLSAFGGAFLSSDSLVFTTLGERPTALSIVLQGTSFVPNGAVYGQGVRCLGGLLKRLYTKSAVGGRITVPEFGAGDPQVSIRSALMGDRIAAGQSRWYLVYYRDPVVLNGCPATSTFNATQTGRVGWLP